MISYLGIESNSHKRELPIRNTPPFYDAKSPAGAAYTRAGLSIYVSFCWFRSVSLTVPGQYQKHTGKHSRR